MYSATLLVVALLICNVLAAVSPKDSSDEPIDNVVKKPDFGLFSMPTSNDAVFTFIRNLMSTGHASAQMALNRLKTEADKRKKLVDEIREMMRSATKSEAL